MSLFNRIAPFLLLAGGIVGATAAAAAEPSDWGAPNAGYGVGWSDAAGLGGAALGEASTRTIQTYAVPRSTYVPCMKWETVWDPFPFFGYRRVRVPC